MPLFRDRKAVEISDRQMTTQGFLVVKARFARDGIQEYFAIEFGDLFPDRKPFDVIRVYRPADEVFKQESMDTFKGAPVTVDHPFEDVTASNWEKYAAGHAGDTIAQEGNFLSTTLTITKAGAVNDVDRGKRELSAGYSADVEVQAGTTPDGETYDAVMTNIVGNHIAIVDAARCGAECRAGDRATVFATDCATAKCTCQKSAEAQPKDQTMLKVVIDGITIETTEAGKEAIDKLQGQLSDANTKISELQGAATAAEKTHADAIAAKEAEITELKDAAPSAEDMDKRIEARAALMNDAKLVVGDDFDAKGKTDAEIRKAVVTKSLGDDAVKEMDDAAIQGAYAVVIKQASKDHNPFAPSAQTTDSGAPASPAANGDSYKTFTDSFAADHPSMQTQQ